MDLLKYIGGRIRELRQGYGGGDGISQDALAQALGVAKNTISRWETATHRPSIEDLEKLARFFGVPILGFFPPEEQPESDQLQALLRAAQDLPDEDLEELRRYAEFRKARGLYQQVKKPSSRSKKKAD
ncbi:helix-turn-helix transcriptional regulator [Nodosilinea sp. AN01ver1]|uniref:helix-turn-helix transcriptional regulator n=1 Tax=Nodosilinea sp. AN01ver1 TaxID=3423362 RepID=UPI003D316D98